MTQQSEKRNGCVNNHKRQTVILIVTRDPYRYLKLQSLVVMLFKVGYQVTSKRDQFPIPFNTDRDIYYSDIKERSISNSL
jgi:hypothetical protein